MVLSLTNSFRIKGLTARTKVGQSISLGDPEFCKRRTHTDCNCINMGIRSRAIIIYLQRWRTIL